MATLRVSPDTAGYKLTIDGLPLESLGELRRWTVDKQAGEPPKLYIETVGDADIEIPGVEVHQNIVNKGAGMNGQVVADWLSQIDPSALEAEALESGDFGESVAATMLKVLAAWAAKA